MSTESVVCAGIRFDKYERGELLDKLFLVQDGLTIVVTPNVDHVIRANKNVELLKLYLEWYRYYRRQRPVGQIKSIYQKIQGHFSYYRLRDEGRVKYGC